MISEQDEGQVWRDRFILTWSFFLAMPVALALWLILGWAMIVRPLEMLKQLAKAQPTPQDIVMSTSIIHSYKSVPEPQARPRLVPEPQRQAEQQQGQRTQPRAERTAEPTPSAAPTEIARFTPHAAPEQSPAKQVQRKASLSETLAQQNADFSREARQLNAADQAPISVATIDPRQRSSSEHQYHIDISGANGRSTEGIIVASGLERVGKFDCYDGAEYTIEWDDGHTEEGTVPWRFCMPADRDTFNRPPYRGPIPLPLPGYRLPPGTQLQPQAKLIYDYFLSLEQEQR